MLRRLSGSASDLPDAPGIAARRRARPRAGGRGPRLRAAGSRPRPPQATAFGKDAYSSLDAKAAALLHSLARNHALIDGNKRLALAAVIAFYGLNGRSLTFTNDQAYELVMKVAAGELNQVEEISAVLQGPPHPASNDAASRPANRAGALTEGRLLRPDRADPAQEGHDHPNVSVANEIPGSPGSTGRCNGAGR